MKYNIYIYIYIYSWVKNTYSVVKILILQNIQIYFMYLKIPTAINNELISLTKYEK